MRYFAYGSNMHPWRMANRVTSCRALGVAHLRGYQLQFHKNSTDGSAKCNALSTGLARDEVVGVVYEMHSEQRPQLDRAEGLGSGYDEAQVIVAAGEQSYRAFMYVAQAGYIGDALLPYTWYKAYVLDGAKHFGLPQSQLRHISRQQAVRDHDQLRAHHHFEILKKFSRSNSGLLASAP